MTSLSDTYTLSNGVKIPILGYGTWQVTDPQEAVDGVKNAVKVGYRHIDTCLLYTSPSPRDRTRSRMPSSA